MMSIEVLRDEKLNGTEGQTAHQLWEMFGKSAPVAMSLVNLEIEDVGTLAPRALALGQLRTTGHRAATRFLGST